MTNKIEKFFQKELTPKLQDLLVVKSEDGSYHLFGKYKIIQDKTGYYNVENKKSETYTKFSSLKNAVSYCVFEKHNKKDYNKRLLELDNILASLEASILMHKKLLASKKPIEDKMIFLNKLEEEKRKKRKLNEEIEAYINTSKAWQTKLYQDNTPRYSRSDDKYNNTDRNRKL